MLDPTKLLDAGPLGVLVFIVVVFLWYIDRANKQNALAAKERDAVWQQFYREQRAADNAVITNLVADVKALASELVALRADFNDHNTWERAKIDEMSERIRANRETPTQPRTRRGRTEG